MNIVFPDYFIDAKLMLSDALEVGKLRLRNYGDTFTSLCTVSHFSISGVAVDLEEDEKFSNLDLTLVYTKSILGRDNKFTEAEFTRNLRVFCSLGDTKWTMNMKNRLWNGNYPTTVALDKDTGTCIFIGIGLGYVELIEFGGLFGEELEAVINDVDDREPYEIKIVPDAMFEYIDGSEGVNHLKSNIFVEFKCLSPIRVTSKSIVELLNVR